MALAGAGLCVRESGSDRPVGEEENWAQLDREERRRMGVLPDGLVRICNVWLEAIATGASEDSDVLVTSSLVVSSADFKGSRLRGGDSVAEAGGEVSRLSRGGMKACDGFSELWPRLEANKVTSSDGSDLSVGRAQDGVTE